VREVEHRAAVPPQAGADDEVVLEEGGHAEQHLGGQEAAQALTDERVGPASPVVAGDERNELVGQELLEGHRPARGGVLLLIGRDGGGKGEVAPAVHIGDTHHDAGWHPLDPRVTGELQPTHHVHEILLGTAIEQEDDRVVRHGIGRVTGRQVDVEDTVLAQDGGMQRLDDADGVGLRATHALGWCVCSALRTGGGGNEEQGKKGDAHGAMCVHGALSVVGTSRKGTCPLPAKVHARWRPCATWWTMPSRSERVAT
jgi:hypothetical protein